MTHSPKKYFTKHITLEWDKNLTAEQMGALRDGEVFILLNEQAKPYSQVFMDSYDRIREGIINEPREEELMKSLYGLPTISECLAK